MRRDTTLLLKSRPQRAARRTAFPASPTLVSRSATTPTRQHAIRRVCKHEYARAFVRVCLERDCARRPSCVLCTVYSVRMSVSGFPTHSQVQDGAQGKKSRFFSSDNVDRGLVSLRTSHVSCLMSHVSCLDEDREGFGCLFQGETCFQGISLSLSLSLSRCPSVHPTRYEVL
jgi:hypothetical protein